MPESADEHRRRRWPSRRIAASALVLFGIVYLGAAGVRADAPPGGAPARDPRIFGVARESKGAVTVILTPTKHAGGRLFVDIRVDTLVANLDMYDLGQLVVLSSGDQNTPPASAPKLRGRHGAGQLIFPLRTVPRSFVIRIYGLDQPALRVFSWPLEVMGKPPATRGSSVPR